MPKKSKQQTRFYIASIKKLIVIKQDMSLRDIRHKLEQNNIHLDIAYISKLREGILHEISEKIDQEIGSKTT